MSSMGEDGDLLISELSKDERLRYSRHLILPEVGSEGQLRLKGGKVLVIGAGGLGAPAILYLAAAGVGTIGIADFDRVDLSNLQRQVIYTTADVGESKVRTARQKALALNPDINVVEHEGRIGADNIADLVKRYDIVVDGTDNFTTRYLVNDACVLLKRPNVYGSIYRFEGQASVFLSGEGPCYRCIFPDPPGQEAVPNCAEGGVLGVMAGIIGVIQATEAVKLLLGKGSTLSGRLLLYDALDMRFDTLRLERNPACPICGDKPSITTIQESQVACAAEASPAAGVDEIEATELSRELNGASRPMLLDVRNPEEHDLCHLSGAVLIPLPQLSDRFKELDAEADIVVYCKGGTRSRKAVELLRDHGFRRLRNLKGGILAWAHEVDRTMPTY